MRDKQDSHVPEGYRVDHYTPEYYHVRCPDCGSSAKTTEHPRTNSKDRCPRCDRARGVTPISPEPRHSDESDEQAESTDEPAAVTDGGMTDANGPIDWKQQIARTLHVENDEESHTERDAVRFHPSQLARCKRQALISKFGLEDHDTDTLGVFQVGTLIHEWLEQQMGGRFPGVHVETPISQKYRRDSHRGVIEVVGTADVYDEHAGVVYDWKTRGGWYKFDPPSERHLNQLTLYMDALDADAGQIVYLNKNNLEVRTWPEGDTFAFDPDRRDQLVSQAFEMQQDIKQADEIDCHDDVPAEPCGCWLCNQEQEGK